jgi:hypothetical protein
MNQVIGLKNVRKHVDTNYIKKNQLLKMCPKILPKDKGNKNIR